MSHDIVDSMGLSETLVVVGGVEDQLADQQAVVADDADVEVSDEEPDNLAFVGPSDANVEKLVEVAQGDLAVGVDLVGADTEVLGGLASDGAALRGASNAENGVWLPRARWGRISL